jgi:hypothetical protein
MEGDTAAMMPGSTFAILHVYGAFQGVLHRSVFKAYDRGGDIYSTHTYILLTYRPLVHFCDLPLDVHARKSDQPKKACKHSHEGSSSTFCHETFRMTFCESNMRIASSTHYNQNAQPHRMNPVGAAKSYATHTSSKQKLRYAIKHSIKLP